MSKIKYHYDPNTLSYKRIEVKKRDRIAMISLWMASSLLFAFLIVAVASNFISSPRDKARDRELNEMVLQYEILQKKLDQASTVLTDLQERDDNVYRVIFEAEPYPKAKRQAGFGGINRYKNLEGKRYSELMIETTEKVDKLTKQLYAQSKSLDEIVDLAKNKEELMRSIPAIQPVRNENLKRMASGYGMRMHPILKYRKMHFGMDFSAKTGTPIYATGDGVIRKVTRESGFGKHVVIDHGFGYRTLYAHMSKYNVKRGQKVKRGEIIGYVGNTGLSHGPHLHYEVHKNGKRVNPVNFYHLDLTAEEYVIMLDIANRENQAFD